MKALLAVFNRLYRPVNQVESAIAQVNTDIVERREVIRDGIRLRFLQRKGGDFLILAERRGRPLKRATFLVPSSEALAWRDEGIVPSGEVEELFGKLQLATWPGGRGVASSGAAGN